MDPRPCDHEQVLLPHLQAIHVDRIVAVGQSVRVHAHCTASAGVCPSCATASDRVHGRYQRTLLDLPIACREVVVQLTVRRFRCANPQCPVHTFAEQVPGLTSAWARRTAPVTALLAQIGLVLAGRAGARLADTVGAGVGRNVLLRIIRALPDPDPGRVQVLGVDDFALRRGHVYGTVLVDMDTHRPIELLRERTAEPVTAWLRGQPDVAIVCRDRAGAYAQAARDGAPEAIQVADRWHLWHNLTQQVDQAVRAHRRCWNTTASRSNPLRTNDSQPNSLAPSTDRPPGSSDLPTLESTQVHDGGRLAQRARERWTLIHHLLEQGMTLKQVARTTGLSRGTVRRFARAAHPTNLDPGARPRRGSVLDRHRAFLAEQWLAGNTNAADLHRLLRQQGYRGSDSLLRQYLQPWRSIAPSGTSTASSRIAAPVRTAPVSARDVTRWICTRPGDLTDVQTDDLLEVRRRCPHLDRICEHVRSFADMLTTHGGERLNDWIRGVQDDDHQPQLASFVRGILADYDAVRAGLILPHSSGPVEGNVTRIKMIKRKMYGRAGFDLLRKLVVLGP